MSPTGTLDHWDTSVPPIQSRRIVTALPSPTAQATLAALEHLEPASMHEEVPIAWHHAQGCEVWDADGNRWLDGCSGIFAVNCGHNHPYINAALIAALSPGGAGTHSYLYPTGVRANLLARLKRLTGYEAAFLCTTGSEAVEAALRIARAYTGRDVILSRPGCFHGKTLGAKLLKHYHYTDASYEPERIAAYIFESYQGWSARLVPPSIFGDMADDALLIADEVQAGFGRTGKWFGFEHFNNVRPDLVVCGKALGNGVPVAAVLGRKELFDAVPDLNSTHSGHPLGCIAALATLDVLETERLIYRASVSGSVLRCNLERIAEGHGCAVEGVGMVWALHYGDMARANAVVDAAFQRGLLLVRTNAGTVKFGPPLNASGGDLAEMLSILGDAVAVV